ncbi:MAG: uroporphyrinogen decarboxylase family protein [Oscillospiraceae bacterium]|jgi:uroporphyrinogen decarboxylase|nr:uroporphyrinogen decarboxylase family protein [Oscillospiraceae bacterium]
MTNRERVQAILHYQPTDHVPCVHFGYWQETRHKWLEEGYLTPEEATSDTKTALKQGFDFEWTSNYSLGAGLNPGFETRVVAEFPDGSRHVRNGQGVTLLERPGATSIPAEIAHLLTDRASWEEHYLPRVQYKESRVPVKGLLEHKARFEAGQLSPDHPYGFYIGGLYGTIRDIAGVVGLSYIQADDEDLYEEIIRTFGELHVKCTEEACKYIVPGMFDFGHFWEDICFRSGPLVIPSVFDELVGPYYKRITDSLRGVGIDICSLDCDGCIDALIPTWVSNGVNTMFPIEVGVWDASIAPWRKKYGKELRGVGGMNKKVFAEDFAAIDRELERLQTLVALGGYIPCPDHRIAPDAKWENVLYYTKRFKELF